MSTPEKPLRLLLVVNPAAGSLGTLNRLGLLERAAHMAGNQLDIVLPDNADSTIALAQHGVTEGYDRIIAGGGDGTINRVASVLVDTGIPLGIIPFGTANVLAREFGIPLQMEAALRVAMTGIPRPMDVGYANGRFFALTAGLGFDAQVVTELVPRFKELFGPMAYIGTGLQVLTRYKPSVFHIEVDNSLYIDVSAWMVVVNNAGYYAYQLSIAPDARIDDGLFDVCLFAEETALDRLVQIGAVFVGRHVSHPNVSYFRTRRLRISATPPVHVQLDGDSGGMTPVDIDVHPHALRVIAPAK